MKLNPKSLMKLALVLIAIPIGVSLVSQVGIWVLPECNPNPYSLEGCIVLAHSLAAALVTGLFGGAYLAVVVGVFVSAPMLVISFIWALYRRCSRGTVA